MGARDQAARAARARCSPVIARITALVRVKGEDGKPRELTAEEAAELAQLRAQGLAAKQAQREAKAREAKNQGAGADEPAGPTTPPPPPREGKPKRRKRRES